MPSSRPSSYRLNNTVASDTFLDFEHRSHIVVYYVQRHGYGAGPQIGLTEVRRLRRAIIRCTLRPRPQRSERLRWLLELRTIVALLICLIGWDQTCQSYGQGGIVAKGELREGYRRLHTIHSHEYCVCVGISKNQTKQYNHWRWIAHLYVLSMGNTTRQVGNMLGTAEGEERRRTCLAILYNRGMSRIPAQLGTALNAYSMLCDHRAQLRLLWWHAIVYKARYGGSRMLAARLWSLTKETYGKESRSEIFLDCYRSMRAFPRAYATSFATVNLHLFACCCQDLQSK